MKSGQIIEIPSSSSIFAEDFPPFETKLSELKARLKRRDYNLFDGFLVGEHPGTSHFKLGQRKGINVGGKKAPLYVIGINTATNQLFVGEGEQHPGLHTTVLKFAQPELPHDFKPSNLEEGQSVLVHSQLFEKEMMAQCYLSDQSVFLEFEEAVPISIQDYPLQIKWGDLSKTTINLNK